MRLAPGRHPAIRHRVGAGALDLCFLGVAGSIVTWFGLAFRGPAPDTYLELIDGVSRLWLGGLLPASVLVITVSMAFCWSVMMATPGQLLMGCRVVRARDGKPLNLVVALWRGTLLVVLGGAVGIPLVTILFDCHRRGIHDWLSFSMVTFEDESRVSLDQWKEEIA